MDSLKAGGFKLFNDIIQQDFELLTRALDASISGIIITDNQHLRDERPALVLPDLWMPVLPGDRLLRSLRQSPATAGLPVIVISANRDSSTITMEAGATDFIFRHFELDALLAKVSGHIPAA